MQKGNFSLVLISAVREESSLIGSGDEECGEKQKSAGRAAKEKHEHKEEHKYKHKNQSEEHFTRRRRVH